VVQNKYTYLLHLYSSSTKGLLLPKTAFYAESLLLTQFSKLVPHSIYTTFPKQRLQDCEESLPSFYNTAMHQFLPLDHIVTNHIVENSSR
jgi:hypothetical protein